MFPELTISDYPGTFGTGPETAAGSVGWLTYFLLGMTLCFIEPAEAIRVMAESVGREARRELLAEVIQAWVDDIPEEELAHHYDRAVRDLGHEDLSMLAAWHATLEVGTPMANADFLVGAFEGWVNTSARRSSSRLASAGTRRSSPA